MLIRLNRLAPHFVLALTLCLPACIQSLDQEESRLGAVVDDCLVPVPAGVDDLAAPVTLEFEGGSVWIWESLTMADGSEVRSAFALVESAKQVCTTGPTLVVDEAKAPVSALPLSAAEIADDAVREDGKRLVLVPSGGFVHDEVGYLYYEERLNGPGFFDSEFLGRGLCVFREGPTQPCERISVAGSTRLWTTETPPLNRGGVVSGDYAILYGCFRPAAFEDMCLAFRAPLAKLEDPGAYEVFNVFNGWGQDFTNGSVVMKHTGSLSIQWNNYLDKYCCFGD